MRTVAAYHEGERAVQARAGVRDMADRIAGSVHDRIPERAADFLREAPLLVVTLADADGWPWPTALAGLPGTLVVPDEHTLELEYPRALLPDGAGPRPGDAIGILALDPSTRRRARVNGRIADAVGRKLRVAVEEVYSNCQKYIQRQELTGVVAEDRAENGDGHLATRASAALSPAQVAWIRAADTFFIASLHPTRGADASHRGGRPGFVAADSGTVSWPDYPGNAMFNTLGNLTANPRAALLFVDFSDGRTLRVVGSPTIEWDDAAEGSGAAERRVTLRVRRVVEAAGEFPLRFRLTEYSPHNPPVA